MAKKKGKYADVMGGLTPRPVAPEDLPRQEQINQLKDKLFAGLSTVELAERYAVMRMEYDLVDAKQSALWIKVEAAQQLLAASLENKAPEWGQYGAAENALRLPSGDTIRVDKEPQGRVVDKEAFRLWCIANGYERQLALHVSTMNSLVKERLVQGEAGPDGTEVNSYTKVVFTPAKAPKEPTTDISSFVEVE